LIACFRTHAGEHLQVTNSTLLDRTLHTETDTLVTAGFSDWTTPIGLQIIGSRHSTADVLTASAAFERATVTR
jgi:hypothetical protein